MDTQGDPIKMIFPGIKDTIFYSGKGTIAIPPRSAGAVRIVSGNPNNTARVRIWEVVNH
ncbi:MAG TPA: hypothetical protein VFQ59_00505 [Candidatus Paceibacterota bacterium]|nr:hypothetical protein [Candidatus Paceibacterota bacterium]